jgi:integrase
MQWAPDSTDLWAPDSERRRAWASDSDGHLTLIQAIDLFLAAKAAEGISPKTGTWYQMILARLGRAFESDQGVDALTAPALRAWIVGLQATLAPVSIAGYVRALKAFGNWLHAEELADAAALRGLRKPRVPVKLIEPVPDDTLRRLLGIASVRDRAIVLLLLDTGLRVSEAAGIRLGDLRPDGSVKVMGKGAKERIVPIGSTARGAIVRYIAQRGPGATDAPLFLGRRGRSTGVGCSRSSSASRPGPGSLADAARTRSDTPSPAAISSTAATSSVCSGSSATRRSTWSSATSRWQTRTSRPSTAPHHRRIALSVSLGGELTAT